MEIEKSGGINIAKAILAVYSEVGYVNKNGKNSAQNYAYAGEADFIEALRPAMIAAGLISLPVKIVGECRHIPGDKDTKPKNHAAYIYTFRIIHAASGEYIDVEAAGEGIGNDDKSSYKAATGAQKYALRQLFLIETGNDPDKDPVTVRKREEEETARRDEVMKYLVVIPMSEKGYDWVEYKNNLCDAIFKIKSFDEFNKFRDANTDNCAKLKEHDPKLREEVSKVFSAKQKAMKAPPSDNAAGVY